MKFVQELYPSNPPVWYSINDVDEPIIENVLKTLTNTKGRDNYIINQVKYSYPLHEPMYLSIV